MDGRLLVDQRKRSLWSCCFQHAYPGYESAMTLKRAALVETVAASFVPKVAALSDED